MTGTAPSPVIAITMGGRAGSGPSIVAKELAAGTAGPCRPLLVAGPEVMERAGRTAGGARAALIVGLTRLFDGPLPPC